MKILKYAYYSYIDVSLIFENQDVSFYAFCLGIKNHNAIKLDDFEGMIEKHLNKNWKLTDMVQQLSMKPNPR